MAVFSTVTPIGNNWIDSLFAGKYWADANMPYRFPQTAADAGKTSGSGFHSLAPLYFAD